MLSQDSLPPTQSGVTGTLRPEPLWGRDCPGCETGATSKLCIGYLNITSPFHTYIWATNYVLLFVKLES